MTDFLHICWECEANPNLVAKAPEVRDLLKADKDNAKVENQLLLHNIINNLTHTHI